MLPLNTQDYLKMGSVDYLAGEGSKTAFDKQALKLIDEIEGTRTLH